MVTARELRRTLGETMGEKGSSSRPRKTPARMAARQAEVDREEAQREEPPRRTEVRSPPPFVQLEPEEEEEPIEQQFRRREKRPRAETQSSPPQAPPSHGLAQVGASSSGFANCSVAKGRVQKLVAEEGDGFMAGVRPEDVFYMAMHHAYQAALLSYDGAVRVQRMARLSKDQLIRCQKMEEKMLAMEEKVKKAEEDRTTAEMKQGMAESLHELSRQRVTELEQDLELRQGTVDSLTARVAQLEVNVTLAVEEAVTAYKKTPEFKRDVNIHAAQSYKLGFEACQGQLRKFHPDLDQSFFNVLASDDEEEEEDEHPGKDLLEPLQVVPPQRRSQSPPT